MKNDIMQPIESVEITKYNTDDTPIILLDYSGSTGSKFSDNDTIFDHMLKLVKQVSVNDGFLEAHVILWSNKGKYLGKITTCDDTRTIINQEFGKDYFNVVADTVADDFGTRVKEIIQNNSYKPGLTDLSSGFKEIDREWFNDNDDNCDNGDNKKSIYVFTDGEINRDKNDLKKIIKDLHADSKERFDIKIVVLENNDKNYYVDRCTSGNTLVKIIRDNDLSDIIKYIVFFNRTYLDFKDRFTNLYNAKLPDNYVQYGNQCFHIKDYRYFLQIIIEEIDVAKSDLNKCENVVSVDNVDNVNDVTDATINLASGILEMIGFNLIRTIRDIEIATSSGNGCSKYFDKNQLIDFFANMIGIESISEFLKNELIYGVSNVSFQEYRENRDKLFKNTQLSLYDNVRKSISVTHNSNVTTFIQNNTVYDVTTPGIDHSVNMGIREYMHSAIYDDTIKQLVPILPVETYGTRIGKKSNNQSLRQWVRTIYSKKYGLPASSDLIHYAFLLDNALIQLSDDVPDHIKEAYLTIAHVMMVRARYGENIQEIMFIKRGNRPKPIGSDKTFEEFIIQCPNYSSAFKNKSIDPMSVWYLILKTLSAPDNNDLLTSQSSHYNPGIAKDFSGLDHLDDSDQILDIMKSLLRANGDLIKVRKIADKQILNYYCFITMSNTELEGGYTFYEHPVNQNNRIICNPGYVISKEAMVFYNQSQHDESLRCPHCNARIDCTKMVRVGPCVEDSDTDDDSHDMGSDIYQDICIENEGGSEIIELNKLDFANDYGAKVSYQNHRILADKMDSYSVMNCMNSNRSDYQTEFNHRVPGFLKNVDMTDLVIAGGMCRSILLNQPIQDIDLFFVNLSEDGIRQRILPTIQSIKNALLAEDMGYGFILMHKPLYNVIEILCTKPLCVPKDENQVKDPEDSAGLADTFALFNSVFKILPDIQIIAGNDDSDEKDFVNNTVIHKIQIILKVNKNIENVFDSFDMHPACVAFDGYKTYFNEASYLAYKYMVNLVNPIKSRSSIFNERLKKYYNYGFSVGVDMRILGQKCQNLQDLMEENNKRLIISRSVFIIIDADKGSTDSRYITADFCKIMKQTANDGESESMRGNEPDNRLYTGYSNSYCNMHLLYRYVKEQVIKYCYLTNGVNSDIDDVIDIDGLEFLESVRDSEYDWYGSIDSNYLRNNLKKQINNNTSTTCAII
jgi:hypothetical protein